MSVKLYYLKVFWLLRAAHNFFVARVLGSPDID